VTFWGVRGSIPAPDADKLRYGGNTPCVAIGLEDDVELILDAGTGIRRLGERLAGGDGPIHILLTHLHLDHIMGLLFFAPCFDPLREITVWGPPGAFRPLRQRLARYLSQPLSPIDIRELPARMAFNEVGRQGFSVGNVRVRAELVSHRGPTLGFRVDTPAGSVCYLPDHEPALGQDLTRGSAEWISGFGLAEGVTMLIHDCQYTVGEYERHTRGWGHSSVDDAIAFAQRAAPERVVLFHHDPGHDDDFLDEVSDGAAAAWADHGHDPASIGLAVEGRSVDL
jgi:phosphoribosyl 1,2-cyclic phosphodiesterase